MKKSSGQSAQSSQQNATMHLEQDKVVQETENSVGSRLSESGRERRPSLGESGKRRSRSRERDKAFSQDLPLFPDVIGTEG